jgi:Fuc2NAc and GlcNAc transferase
LFTINYFYLDIKALLLPFMIFLIGFFTGFIGLRFAFPILFRYVLDLPDKPNSAQLSSKPSAGGVVFVLLSIFISLLSMYLGTSFYRSSWIAWIPIFCLPLAIISLIDDISGLSIWVRFGIQFPTAALFLAISPLRFPPLIWIIVLITVVAIINLINFMDGLDGMVGGASVFLLLAATLSFPLYKAVYINHPHYLYFYGLIGAILGFLIWNWYPSKVFMGDVGSTFLGAIYVATVLQMPSYLYAFSLLLVSFPFLADAGGCIVRRIRFRKSILQHRTMLYQRLHQRGFTHAQVSSFFLLLIASLAIAHLFWGLKLVLVFIAVQSAVLILVDMFVAVPFSVSIRIEDEAKLKLKNNV